MLQRCRLPTPCPRPGQVSVVQQPGQVTVAHQRVVRQVGPLQSRQREEGPGLERLQQVVGEQEPAQRDQAGERVHADHLQLVVGEIQYLETAINIDGLVTS